MKEDLEEKLARLREEYLQPVETKGYTSRIVAGLIGAALFGILVGSQFIRPTPAPVPTPTNTPTLEAVVESPTPTPTIYVTPTKPMPTPTTLPPTPTKHVGDPWKVKRVSQSSVDEQFLLPGDILYVSASHFKVGSVSCDNQNRSDFLCVYIHEAAQEETVRIENLIPGHAWIGVTHLGTHNIINDRMPYWWIPPNCVDGCEEVKVVVRERDGSVLNLPIYTKPASEQQKQVSCYLDFRFHLPSWVFCSDGYIDLSLINRREQWDYRANGLVSGVSFSHGELELWVQKWVPPNKWDKLEADGIILLSSGNWSMTSEYKMYDNVSKSEISIRPNDMIQALTWYSPQGKLRICEDTSCGGMIIEVDYHP